MQKPPGDLQSLIDVSRRAHQPKSADRDKVSAALAVKLGRGALVVKTGGTIVASGASSVLTTASLAGVVAKIAVVGVFALGAVGTATVLARRRVGTVPQAMHTLARVRAVVAREARSAPAPSVVVRSPALALHAPASSPLAAASAPIVRHVNPVGIPRVTLQPAEPSVVTAPNEQRQTEIVLPTVALVASPNVIAESLALRAVQQARRAGTADIALQRLDEYAVRFPNGALREEAQAARVLTLCDLGRREDARAETRQFLRDASQSPLASRVLASCGGER